MPEGQLISTFESYSSATGDTIDSSLSLATMRPNTLVYYDHWEDGYETDLENPVQSSTEIWGDGDDSNGKPPGFATDTLTSNSVVSMRNDVPTPRNASTQLFDGRDRIGVTQPVALTRLMWPTAPGSVLAGSIQIQSTLEYGSEYVVPLGEDEAFNEIFERVELYLMAERDDTVVQIDANADGTYEVLTQLDRGESFVQSGIKLGARATASHPVQAHLVTGDVDASHETRFFNLFPREIWDNEYFNPMSTRESGRPAAVLLFNPHSHSLSVKWESKNDSGNINVSATSVAWFEMPDDSGARFYTVGGGTKEFMAYGIADASQSSDNNSYEWGVALIPESSLTAAVKLGFSPGSSDVPPANNGSPVWVISDSDTRLYIDYDGDLTTGANTDPNGNHYDLHQDVVALDSIRIFDTDNDQTGMRVYTLDGAKITAAWGEDSSVANSGNPYLDLGYTVLPHPLFTALKTGAIVQDLNLDGVADEGDIIEYRIEITNLGIIPVSGVTVTDVLEGNVSYETGTTTLDDVPVVDDTVPPSSTVFPLDEDGFLVGDLNVNQTRVIEFRALVGRQDDDAVQIRNVVIVSINEQEDPEKTVEETPTRPTPCRVSTISAAAPGLPLLTAGYPAAFAFEASGDDGPFTFSIQSGALPNGLVMDAAGQVTGTPTGAGESTFTVQATDRFNCPTLQSFTVTTRRPLAVGNLVFFDANENGLFDEGEGVEAVDLELYLDSQTPGVDVPVASTATDADGGYLFDALLDGNYVVHVPARNFGIDGPLFGTISIFEGLNGDDDVGENGINIGSPAVDGVSSAPVGIGLGLAPTELTGETGFRADIDDSRDAAVDLTIDFGFQIPLGLGNLIFIDANGNDVFDSGEGVNGVAVELYEAAQVYGADLPIFSTTTDADGRYLFDNLPSGSYFIAVPGSEFEIGRPLAGLLSIPGHLQGEDDDQSEDGIDDLLPDSNGIRSHAITLAVGGSPTDAGVESGGFSDDDNASDTNFDLTLDLGFRAPAADAVGVGNLVFIDADGSGSYEIGEGVDGVIVQLFLGTDDPQTDTPLSTTFTVDDGHYLFTGLAPGEYRLHIPGSEFQSGAPLFGMSSMVGAGTDFGLDDDFDENGLDAADPPSTGVSSILFTLTVDGEPTDFSGEFGDRAFSDNIDDDNHDLTIDFGFTGVGAIGNLVFLDANGNLVADAGEGAAGVQVQLFYSWQNPIWEIPVAVTTTDSDGFYLFGDVLPGHYLVHLPAGNFTPSGPLHGVVSLIGDGSGDDHLSEDGIDTARPEDDGVRTAGFYLRLGEAPNGDAEQGLGGSTDDTRDGDIDLTRDFGFAAPATLGNLVFIDVNGNGSFEPDGTDAIPGNADDEYGVGNVWVGVWSVGDDATFGTVDDLPVGDPTATDFDGQFSFTGLAPGDYYLRVAASNFQGGGALVSHPYSVAVYDPSDNQEDNDNNGFQPGGGGTDALSTVIRLSGGEADLTLDFGFVDSLSALTWTGWQTRLPPGTQNTGPTENIDSDLLSNLEEFAFASEGLFGLHSQAPMSLRIHQETGAVDLAMRRLTGIVGVTYTLELHQDLSLSPAGWVDLALPPNTVTSNGDGTETAVFENLHLQPVVAAGLGFVRVRLELDEDRNGTAEAVVRSQVLSWNRHRFAQALQTFVQTRAPWPLVGATVTATHSSSVDLSDSLEDGTDLASLLQPGLSYYLEVIEGDHAGHRLEVDEGGTSGTTVALVAGDPRSTLSGLPSTLTDDRVLLRRHTTLADRFPPARFHGTFNPTTADQVIEFDRERKTFVSYWLFDHPDGAIWVQQGSGSLEDEGDRILPPDAGVFTRCRSSSVDLTTSGWVRDHAFACPLVPGVQLVGLGWPVAVSPEMALMNEANGFTGSARPDTSDQIIQWTGDADPASQNYRSYFLLGVSTLRYWVLTGDGGLADQGQTRLLQRSRARFVRSTNGLSTWVIPCPWTP